MRWHRHTIDFRRMQPGYRRRPRLSRSSWPTTTDSSFGSGRWQKQIGDATVRMLAYNGSIPGPTLRVRPGAELTVEVTNEGDLEDTCTGTDCGWRMRSMERPETPAPMPIGGSFTPAPLSRSRHLLVSPAHPRGLRPGDGPLRQHRRRARRTGLLAARQPRTRAHTRRHPDRGRQGRALQPDGVELHSDGTVRQRPADERRAGAFALGPRQAKSCVST